MLKTNSVKFEKFWNKFRGSWRPKKTLRPGYFQEIAIIQEPVGLLSW